MKKTSSLAVGQLVNTALLALAVFPLVAAEGVAETPLRATITVDLGPDRGQNLGALFEITDAEGNVVAGAGFQGAYNTYVRGERDLLQFFLRPKSGSAKWNIERLPPIETNGTGFYPFAIDGQLYVYNGPRSDPHVYRWNDGQRKWDIVEGVHPKTQVVAGRQLRQQGEQLVYNGATLVDAETTHERIGEFYFAQGNLIVRQFGEDGDARKNRIAVYPWNPAGKPSGLLAEKSAWTQRLPNPIEFFYTFGQWRDQVIGVTNTGTVLRFAGGRWDVLRESIPNVSYQVYCGINFYDKLLLGQYPSGCMFEYAGTAPTLLTDWPPVLKGVAPAARELQTAAIYGGDLYVGVWPWAEVWRYDTNRLQWDFVQRMFNHPELTDKVRHPYEAETQQVDAIQNLWGQRVTGIVPLGESLFITTSSKTGEKWDSKFSFLSPEKLADYPAIHRATVPGNLAVTAEWKPEPTTFEFTLADGELTIRQDGQVLGKTAIDADLQKEFRPAKIRWGEGVFGSCAAKIVKRDSTLALASLPGTMRAAYLHPDSIFKNVADVEDCKLTAKRVIERAKSIRLNALFPYFTGSSGQSFYPSAIVPRNSFGVHDPLDELVREAKLRGMKVYPVLCVAVCGNERPAGVLLEHPEWGLRHPDGSPLGYLSPTHPEARQWGVRVIEEVLDRYKPDGVVLDYIRFHNRPLRLDVAAEERFERSLPAKCPQEERQRQLQAFKEAGVTAWVKEIAEAVRKKQPNAAVGMYCWGPHTVKNHLTAQVWPTWVARGDADFVNISGYYHRDKYGDRFLPLFEQKLSEAVAINGALSRQASLSFALGVNTSHGRIHTVDEIRQYLQTATKVGMDGFAVFSWHDFLPFLGGFTNADNKSI